MSQSFSLGLILGLRHADCHLSRVGAKREEYFLQDGWQAVSVTSLPPPLGENSLSWGAFAGKEAGTWPGGLQKTHSQCRSTYWNGLMWLQAKRRGPRHIPGLVVHRMLSCSSRGPFPKFPGISTWLRVAESAGMKAGRRGMTEFGWNWTKA